MPEKVKRETARERRRRQIGEFHDALIGNRTMADACRIAGISARTGARWIRTNEFAEIYSERHRATIEAASGLLRAGAIGSVEALIQVVADTESPVTARTHAAAKLLDACLRFSELNEFENRLKKLETE